MSDLLVLIPGRAAKRLSLASPTLSIGRTVDQDIVLEDGAVSRSHARLYLDGAEAFVEDLGSRHGTRVNGTQIDSRTKVTAGDVLGLGPLELRLEAADAPLLVPGPPRRRKGETQSLPVAELHGWHGAFQNGGLEPRWSEALDLFHACSLLVLGDQTVDQLLEIMLQRLSALLKAHHGAILLRDATGGFAPIASAGRALSEDTLMRMSPASVQAAIERREALILREDPDPVPGAPTTGRLPHPLTSRAMAVPLERSGEVMGLFYFDTGGTRPPFTEDELRVVASLGNLAAARIIQQRLAQEVEQKRDLERTLQAAATAAQAKDDFLAHMSHEMRTPLNALMGFLHLAQEEAKDSTLQDYLGKVDHAGQSLLDLLTDGLDLSKIEAGRLELESIPFRPREVLDQVQGLLEHTADEKQVVLTATVAPGTPEVLLGDPLRLRQVLINLVGNAVKFTAAGHVAIRLGPESIENGVCHLRVSVEDTGIGLSADQISRLFTPYTQAAAATGRQFGGTGLGLSICRRLVELMGGRIWAEGEPGVGSHFHFTARFPLASLPIQPVPPAPRPARLGKDPHLVGRRVLVADDHAINRELASILLTRLGLQADLAADGSEALALAEGTSYDAILLDLEMPDLDGLEVTRRIRLGARNPQVPILALTAHALSTHRRRCLDGGMNDCLTKPIAPADLHAALSHWLLRQEEHTVPSPAELGQGGGLGVAADLACLADVVDLPLALGRLNGQEDLLRRFLRSFAQEACHTDAIRADLAQGRRSAAAAKVHDLKGLAATLAITQVEQGARALEACLATQPPTGWEAACGDLQVALDAFQARMRQVP